MGDPTGWDQDLWMWPLPAPGDQPLQLTIDWPEQDIAEETVELDLGAIEAASERAITLWTDDAE